MLKLLKNYQSLNIVIKKYFLFLYNVIRINLGSPRKNLQTWAAEQGGHWGTVPPHFCKNQENVPFFDEECALWKL